MKTLYLILSTVLFTFLISSCSKKQVQLFKAQSPEFKYLGRTEIQPDSTINLITSASGVEIIFTGDSCSVLMKNAGTNPYNFMTIEVDGEYQGRIKLLGDSLKAYPILLKKSMDQHHLFLVKSTEAANGAINFGGINCESLIQVKSTQTTRIEFIGNSITCAMGVDTTTIPCHTGQWYDQHNAYYSYARLVAKNLNADYMLSSVSGIGIYRNWNGEGAVMPQVYENIYLDTDSTKKWDFKQFTPDIVSIALGTNDLSDGDGKKFRTPFSVDSFSIGYINFVQTIYSKYPDTKVAILTSPMVTGQKDSILNLCLQTVKEHFKDKKIEIFRFSSITPHGCDYHPLKEEQQKMSEELVPFFKKLLGSN
jgi:hypothetical protein